MKKKIICSFLIGGLLQSAHAMDSIGLHELPSLLWGQKEDLNLNISGGLTFSWYKLGKSTINDVGNNADQLKNSNTKVAPGFFVALDRYYDDIAWWRYSFPLHYGIKVSYAHRNKAIKSDFYDAGQATPILFTYQDVRDFRVTPYITLTHSLPEQMTKKCRYNFYQELNLGFGIGVKTLDNLKLYEKATGAYIGQKLKSGSMSFLGEFGYAWVFEINKEYSCKLGYQFTFGKPHYKRKVFIENADSAASLRFIHQAFLIDKEFVNLAKSPKMRMRCHSLQFSITKEFGQSEIKTVPKRRSTEYCLIKSKISDKKKNRKTTYLDA